MKIYRNGIYIGLIICIVSFLIMLSAKFFPIVPILIRLIIYIDEINEFIFNMASGVFCSALVVVLTYIGAYKIEKKKTIGELRYYCSKYTLELSDLVHKLFEYYSIYYSTSKNDSNALYYLGIEVSKNTEIYNLAKILTLYEERILSVDGYYPFLKRNKKNLDISYLMYMQAKINDNVRYLELSYKINNNIIYKQELKVDMEKLIAALRTLMQKDDKNEYKEYLDIFEKIATDHPATTIYNTNWRDKCL